MKESLQTARSTYQFLLGVCGVYLLGRFVLETEGLAGTEITFLGLKFAHPGFFNLVVAVVFLLTALRLVAYLQHIRMLPKGKEEFQCMREYPWLLLCRRTKLNAMVMWFEIFIMLIVGAETGRLLQEIFPIGGWLYILILLWAFVYGIKQVHEIKDEPAWPDS